VSDQDQLRSKLSEIGVRYINRTLTEIEQLKVLSESAASGSMDALKELGTLAHRIRGSGAMFGYHSISKSAESIELLANRGSLTEADVSEMRALVDELCEEVRRAARERGSA
jgi:HPt (histidine-containing phosphotransfer) domain-containing protein